MLYSSKEKIEVLCITPECSIWRAVEAIDQGGCKTAFVLNTEKKLVGLIADPDIRRALLENQSFEAPVSSIMNRTPLSLADGTSKDKALRFIQYHKRDAVPVLDKAGTLVDVLTLSETLSSPLLDNEVVLMAGGMGKRLLPLTEHQPKPMVEIASKPILEHLIDSLASQGFKNFALSINYMGEAIKDFFGNGEKWGINIRYIEEQSPLGTAGALSIMSPINDKPIIVMNGDVLTKVDFQSLLLHHHKKKCSATVCVSQQEIQIPYGVIEHENMQFKEIVEKPVWNYFVNAGVYVFSTETLKLMHKGVSIDMPDFINTIKDNLGNITIFPLHEYWLDVGTHRTLEKARVEYPEQFTE